MTNWPFGSLTPGRYGVILADPPWHLRAYSDVSKSVKSAASKYDVMDTSKISELPVADLAAPDCVLAMWATQAQLHDAVALVAQWGFQFKTSGAWAKQSATGKKWAFGTGFILRSAAEFFLIGARGSPRSAVKNIRNLIVAPTRGHSRKPSDLHDNLDRMYPGVPRCELFARESRDGWETWGNQATKFDKAAA